MRVGVYIDGYNLYYGARGLSGAGTSGWRWLDVRGLGARVSMGQGRRSRGRGRGVGGRLVAIVAGALGVGRGLLAAGEGAPRGFQLVLRAARPPLRWSLSRLWIAHSNRHCARAAGLPRISTRRPSWTVPIWPNTGSTIALRRA